MLPIISGPLWPRSCRLLRLPPTEVSDSRRAGCGVLSSTADGGRVLYQSPSGAQSSRRLPCDKCCRLARWAGPGKLLPFPVPGTVTVTSTLRPTRSRQLAPQTA